MQDDGDERDAVLFGRAYEAVARGVGMSRLDAGRVLVIRVALFVRDEVRHDGSQGACTVDIVLRESIGGLAGDIAEGIVLHGLARDRGQVACGSVMLVVGQAARVRKMAVDAP